MIRIHKPEEAPQKLLIEGKNKRRSHCTSYSRNPVAYQSRAKTFSFSRSLYAHESVRQALFNAQHGKCCYCERKLKRTGDVEHFRPKQACRQDTKQPRQNSGYYWLAYDWQNLYLSCADCNRDKSDLFPLQNPKERTTNHKQSLDREQPLLSDPGKDNPEEFISFAGASPIAIAGNPKARATIAILKLDAQALIDARLERLHLLRELHKILSLAPQYSSIPEIQRRAETARDLLQKAVQEDAEFAAAARCAIQTSFRFVPD